VQEEMKEWGRGGIVRRMRLGVKEEEGDESWRLNLEL